MATVPPTSVVKLVNAVVPTPRTMDLTVQGILLPITLNQLINDFLDMLALTFICNKDCISSLNDDQVIHTDCSD